MSQADEITVVLNATVHDVRYVAALFRSVNFADRATIHLGARGFCISVEEARTLLAKAYISSDAFDEWNYHKPPAVKPPTDDDESDDDEQQTEEEQGYKFAFQIKLNTLIECLNVFGSAGGSGGGPGGKGGKTASRRWKRAGDRSDSDREEDGGGGLGSVGNGTGDRQTSLRMSYAGVGHPLVLIMAEDTGGPTTTCEITTYEPEPMLSLDFEEHMVNVILKSSWLREALSELDPSCEKITFTCNPAPVMNTRAPRINNTKPFFRIEARGSFGSTEMDYPNDREVLETFECQKAVKFTYRFSHINRIVRALTTSTKTSIRMDVDGILAIQLMLPSRVARDSSPEFVDFMCLALDDEF